MGRLSTFIALWLIGLTASAWGNQRILVRARQGNANPYEVVIEAPGGDDVPPGIYTTGPAETSKLILPGTVVGASRNYSGVLSSLDMTSRTGREEAVAIVNGRLTIFSTKTSPRKADTAIVIGSKENPVYDILTKHRVDLPLITNLQDVSVFEGEYARDGEYEGQIVLFSMKHPHPFGSGFTFVVNLEKPEGKSGELPVNGRITLIDYDFMEKNTLSRVAHRDRRMGVYSRILLRSLQAARDTDIPLVRQWRKSLSEFSKWLLPTAKLDKAAQAAILKQLGRMPYYWVPEDTISLDSPPSDLVMTSPIPIRQQLNPLDGSAVLSTGGNATTNQSQTGFQGTLDYNDDGSPVAFTFEDKGDTENSVVVVSRANRLWAVVPFRMHNGGGATELIDLGIEMPERHSGRFDFSVAHRSTGTGDHYLFLSQGGMGRNRTECVVITENGGKMHIDRRIVIYADRYLTPKELNARIRIPADDEFLVLFDNVTPLRKGKRYDSKNDRSTPYLDLHSSTDVKRSQVYLKMLEERQINDTVAFRDYNPEGAVENKTGLYVGVGPQNGDLFIPGRLLTRRGKKVTLDVDELASISGNPAVEVQLYALNPDVSGRLVNEFDIAGVLIPFSANQSFSGTTFRFRVPAKFNQFRGAKVVFGRRKNALQMNILVFFDGADGGRSTDRNGGVYSAQYTLEFNYHSTPRQVLAHETRPGAWLEKEAVPINALKERLIPDSEGQWYWIVDPTMDNKSSQFAVRPLNAPETKTYPRRGGSQRAMKWDETLSTDWGKLLGGSDWIIYGRAALENAHPAYAKIIKTAEEKGDDDKQKNETVFPDLDKFLDEMAEADGPQGATVLLVDPVLKEKLLQRIYVRLALNEKGAWSVSSRQSRDFYFYDVEDQASRERISSELKKIGNEVRGKRRGVIFTDISRVLPPASDAKRGTEQPPQGAEEEEEEVEETSEESTEETVTEDDEEPEEEQKAVKASPFTLFLTGGEDVPVDKVTKGPFKRVPTLIVATPGEWRRAQEVSHRESKAGLFSEYQVIPDFLTSSWTVWPPSSDMATKAVKGYHRAPVSREEHEVFPGLNQLLSDLTDKSKPAKHRILIVPEEIKPLVDKLVLSRWATDVRSLDGAWSYRNRELALFQVSRFTTGDKPVEMNQEGVLDNFAAMRELAGSRRVVLLGRIDELTRLGRPTNGDSHPCFKIKDHAVRNTGAAMEAEVGDSDRQRPPHVMWWVATEGRKLQPREFEKNHTPPTFSSVFVGSERDWNLLRAEYDWESRFGLGEDFEVVQLETPTIEKRQELIAGLFGREEIRKLGYGFKLDDIGGEDAQRQIIALIVNRTSQIARSYNIDDTSAFIRTYAELSRSLSQDMKLRQSKEVNRYFVESLFARIFPIPIALNSLPPTDYLHKLRDPVRAGVAIQQLGYNSPLELKLRAIRTILSQTQGSSPGRPIPSSTILFGGTSTGKTFFFEMLMKYLGLKSYQHDQTDNEEADYYICKVGNLREKDDPSQPENRSVDTELEHISNFLSQPKGHRGFLLFDDLHKAKSTDIYRKIMTFIESLFEAKDGYITVTRKQGTVRREIPVRNINLMITVNPKRDKEIRDRYGADGDIIGEVLAAMARDDYEVEDSLLARFTSIIDMNEFPSEAKAPALVAQVRKRQEDAYRADPRFVVVTPELLDRVVKGNKDANAREFLTTATQGLINVDTELPDAPMYLACASPTMSMVGGKGETRSDKIETFVRANRVMRPLADRTFETQLEFVRLVMGAFRVHVIHTLLQGARRDARLVADHEIKTNVLVPLFIGAADYLDARPDLPLSFVQIHPDDFGGMDSEQRQWMLRLIDNRAEKERGFFPFAFGPNFTRDLPGLSDFVRTGAVSSREMTRLDVLSRFSKQIFDEILPLYEAYFRIGSVSALPTTADWFQRLPVTDPKELMIAIGDRLAALYLSMGEALFDSRLVEMSSGQKLRPFTTFDQARFFLMAADRAILEFPWPRMSHFIFNNMRVAAKDPSLGQKENFQAYLFKNSLSPFNPITIETILQALDSLNEKGMPAGRTDDAVNRFAQSCLEVIARGGT